jgi:hypothetical protein
MSDAAIFVVVMGGMFVLRVIAATIVFCWILPEGDRCPNCDAATLRVQNRWMDRLLPWFRTSWCYHCGWEGVLRRGELSPDPVAPPRVPTPPPHKQLPNETSEA